MASSRLSGARSGLRLRGGHEAVREGVGPLEVLEELVGPHGAELLLVHTEDEEIEPLEEDAVALKAVQESLLRAQTAPEVEVALVGVEPAEADGAGLEEAQQAQRERGKEALEGGHTVGGERVPRGSAAQRNRCIAYQKDQLCEEHATQAKARLDGGTALSQAHEHGPGERRKKAPQNDDGPRGLGRRQSKVLVAEEATHALWRALSLPGGDSQEVGELLVGEVLVPVYAKLARHRRVDGLGGHAHGVEEGKHVISRHSAIDRCPRVLS
mmetsp:Transcript_8021/g.22059  ORF Transcript_8021/g.22059 Transcript_8021/m.22059 type:complete len:269 (+) Transcript_8021:1437-2243(+)